MQTPSADPLVEALYGAVEDPEVWPDFFNQVQTACGANMVGLGLFSAQDDHPSQPGGPWAPAFLTMHGMPPAFQDAFMHDWVGRDGTTVPSLERLTRSGALTSLSVRQAYLPDQEFERSAFYHEFLRPLDQYHYTWTLGRMNGGRAWFAFNVCRSKRAGCFEGQDQQLFSGLTPHLYRALRLQLRLIELERAEGVRADALDALEQPCLAVQAGGRLLWANRSADAILRAADGLCVQAGKVRASAPWQQASLLQAIQTCARRGMCVLHFVRRPPARPLQVTFLPSFSGVRTLAPQGVALLLLTDPDAPQPLRGGSLEQAYRLTPAEGRVAGLLAEGLSPAQIAGRLGVAVGTVRNHLKQVYGKTGTHRQAELVQLVLRTGRLR